MPLISNNNSQCVLSRKDKQVLDVARHVAYKRQTVNQIIQLETSYLNEFCDFQETYATRMQVWLDSTEDKDVTLKLKSTPVKKTLNALFQSLHELSVIHTKFLKEITDRLIIKNAISKIYIH